MAGADRPRAYTLPARYLSLQEPVIVTPSPTHDQPARRLWLVGGGLLLVGVVALLYGRSMAYGYAYWDDHVLVRDNPLLQEASVSNTVEILRPVSRQGEALYIPVAYVAWSLERALFGDAPETFHRVNVALHALNGVLAFLLLLALIGRPVYALLGAMCFVVHPLQVESVAWIMGGRDLLAATFSLLCLLAYLRYLPMRRKHWFLLALFCYGLAVFCKPVAAPLPALLLLLDYRHTGAWRRCLWWAKTPFLAVTLLAVVLNTMTADPTVTSTVGWPLRLLCVPWLVWHWTRDVLLLAAPVPFHPWPASEASTHLALLGCASLGVLIALGVVAWRRRWQAVWQALIACALGFAPAVLVVLEGKRSFMTGDRYGYFPLLALFAVLPCALIPLRGKQRIVGGVLLAAWMLASGAVAHGAVAVWRDGTTVWSRVLEAYPDEPEALVNRGSAHARAGRLDAAWSDYRRALEQRPRDRMLLGNVARLHLERKRPDEALVYLERYLAVGPEDLQTYLGMGYAASQAGRHAAALRWYGEAARLQPDSPEVKAGRRLAMLTEGRRRLAANADDVEALMVLARLADEGGDRAEAERMLRRAIEIPSPQRASAYFHLGRILLDQGSVEAGRTYLRAALEEDPSHALAKRLLER